MHYESSHECLTARRSSESCCKTDRKRPYKSHKHGKPQESEHFRAKQRSMSAESILTLGVILKSKSFFSSGKRNKKTKVHKDYSFLFKKM